MKSKLLILIVILTLFTSCDPSHDIYFINKTDSNVKVKISLEPKADMYELTQIATHDSIVLNVKKDSIAMISFGIGNWSAKQISLATNAIKSIEIETNDIKTIYRSKKAIHSILDKNVHGAINKTDIEINIE